MIRLIPVLFLIGCANSALVIEDTETACKVSGSLLSFDTERQDAPEPNTCFNVNYTGYDCTINVWSKDCPEQDQR